MISNIALLGFAFLMLCAVWYDVRSFTIPNWVPGALIAGWVVAAPFLGLGWMDAGLSFLTGLGVLLLGMALWAPGWLGGGDVKLIAAGALWFGWPDALMFILFCAASGGVLALALMVLRRLSPALPVSSDWIGRTALAQGAPAPYAVAIASGALILLPQSALFAAYGG
jgi:prepilin peptidase CpaA